MLQVPKSEYIDWRSSPITQALYEAVREQAEMLAAEIVRRVDDNPKRDTFCKGVIDMASQVLNWKPEFRVDLKIDEDGNLIDASEANNED